MKKMNLVAIMLIIAALFTAGCLGGEEPIPAPNMEIAKTSEITTGFCGNPEWDGAEPSSVNYVYTVENDTIVVAYVLTLTWNDDHQGTSNSDIYDKFKLEGKAGNSSARETSDTGTLEIVIGAENFGDGEDENATISEDTLKTDYKNLGDCEITVECTAAGTYPSGPLGRVLASYDIGNDWSLKIEAWVLEPAVGTAI